MINDINTTGKSTLKRSLSAVIPILAAALVGLAGCEESTEPETWQYGGAIQIEPAPFTLEAAWTLSGPEDYRKTGNGFAEFGQVVEGDCTITWGDMPDRQTPAPQTFTVLSRGLVKVEAYYASNLPEAVTALVIDGRRLAYDLRPSVLLSVDLRTGVADSLAVLDHPVGVGDIVRGPDDGLWALATGTQLLLRIDPTSYAITIVGVLGDWTNQRVVSLAFSPGGLLYGYDERRECLVIIDPDDAGTTPLAPGTLEWVSSICFSPDGTLLACTYHSTYDLIALDPVTGLLDTVVGALDYQNTSGTLLVGTMAFSPQGILYGISTGQGIGASPSSVDENLVEIDPATGRVWAIGGYARLGVDGFRTPSGLVYLD